MLTVGLGDSTKEIKIQLDLSSDFGELAQSIEAADSLLLVTHAGPDGDGLGCVVALGRALRRAGKRVRTVLPDPPSAGYRFLDPEGFLISFADARAEVEAEEWDTALIVDTHQPSQLNGVDVWLEERGIPRLYLDHHPLAKGWSGPTVYGSKDAVAAGCLVYRLILENLGWKVDRPIAEPLYVSISYDTNSFKYLRSDPEALEIGADLIHRGVDTTWVYRNLFASNPMRKARVLGWVLSHATFEDDGRIGSVRVPHSLIEELKLERDDLRDSVNHILEIDGVEIAAILKETAPNEIKISLRSKGTVAINGVAASFRGGGHSLAAGCEFNGSLDDGWAALRPPLSELLQSSAEREGSKNHGIA